MLHRSCIASEVEQCHEVCVWRNGKGWASLGSNERPARGSPVRDADAVAGPPGLVIFLDPGIERTVSAETLRHYKTALHNFVTFLKKHKLQKYTVWKR